MLHIQSRFQSHASQLSNNKSPVRTALKHTSASDSVHFGSNRPDNALHFVILKDDETPKDTAELKAAATDKGHTVDVINYQDCVLRLDQTATKPLQVWYRPEGTNALKRFPNADLILPRITLTQENSPAVRALMKQLDLIGIPSLNSIEAIETANDKWQTHLALVKDNVPTIASARTASMNRQLVRAARNHVAAKDEPVMIKIPYSTYSQGVEKRTGVASLDTYASQYSQGKNPFFQKFAEASINPEGNLIDYRLLVLDMPNGQVKVRAEQREWLKDQPGKDITKPLNEISPELINIGANAIHAVGLHQGSVDVFKDESNPKTPNWTVNEVNPATANIGKLVPEHEASNIPRSRVAASEIIDSAVYIARKVKEERAI